MRNARLSAIFLGVALACATASIRAETAANQLTTEEKAGGWKLLFDGKTTAGWHSYKKKTFPSHGWVAEDGWLHCLGEKGGDLISDGEFDDFELEWDWKQAPAGNSGVKYFVLETRPSALGHEYQMADDPHEPDVMKAGAKHATASFYDVLAPGPTPTKPPGEINHSRIVVHGNHVEHWLNGKKVLAYECGSEEVRAGVASSKFKNVSGFGEKVTGHLLLQDHNTEVWFQNVKIKEGAGK
jgi:hypothetical protein